MEAIEKRTEPLEVRSPQEGLILDEIFYLVPVVSLERLVLQLLQVTLVELCILHVFCVGWLEELL